MIPPTVLIMSVSFGNLLHMFFPIGLEKWKKNFPNKLVCIVLIHNHVCLFVPKYRYYLIQKAKVAKTVGIVAGTLGVGE